MSKRRVKRIELQLTDAVDMLANGLKAGLSLRQAFEMASLDAPSPVKEEFTSIINRVKLGASLEDALSAWKDAVRLDDVDILVESILVLRQTGGNLIETFDRISETIRERQKVAGKIRVLTAQGVSQAVIILILPALLALGLYLVAPSYITPLFTEPLGYLLLLAALLLQVAGALWLRKIVRVRL